MADNGRAKRLKSSSEDDIVAPEVAELRGRIADLESAGKKEVAELQGRITELESEIEQLRRRGRDAGNHEMLPVVVATTVTVDLSHAHSSIVAQISSFLGTSNELLNLGLTCKSFGWRQPTSTLNMSLVEEVARQTVCSGATAAEMDSLPRYASGTTTWLSILHRFDSLLSFDVLLGEGIEYQDGDRATVHGPGDKSCAAVSSYVMRSGVHYVEFKIISGTPKIGIVRPMPNLDADAYAGESFDWFNNDELHPDFLAKRSDAWGNGNVHACEYDCEDGLMHCTDWEGEGVGWEGWDGMEECVSNDTIGMLLDMDEGTLAVYKNNHRLGVMKDGLSGSYCWYVAGIWAGDIVSMKRGEPPRA